MAAKKKWWVGVLLKGKWKNHQVFQFSGDPGPRNWPDCDYVVGPFDKREDARKWAHVLRSARAAALREVMHMEPKRKQQPPGNPARILLDAVRRAGWAEDEIDAPSFKAAADYCDGEAQCELLDWDVAIEAAPSRPSGTLMVTLECGGRGTPSQEVPSRPETLQIYECQGGEGCTHSPAKAPPEPSEPSKAVPQAPATPSSSQMPCGLICPACNPTPAAIMPGVGHLFTPVCCEICGMMYWKPLGLPGICARLLTMGVNAKGDSAACQAEIQRLANFLGVQVDAMCWPGQMDANSVPVPLRAEPEIK